MTRVVSLFSGCLLVASAAIAQGPPPQGPVGTAVAMPRGPSAFIFSITCHSCADIG